MEQEAKIIFNPCFQIGNNEWLTYLNGQQIVNLWKKSIIEYIPEIQRGTKIKFDKKEKELEVPVFSSNNVKKIYNKIKDNKFYTNQITLNIMKDENDEIFFNDNSLVVKKGTIAIQDGQHRIRSMEMIDCSNKTLTTACDLHSLIFPVKITRYSIEEAQEQFYQFSQGLKISSSRSEYFNNAFPNIVVKFLMEKGNALNNKIEIVKNSIGKKDIYNLVSFATLVNAIETEYIIDNETEALKLANYLNDFFMELINLIPELQNYEKRLESKETSLIAENFMFYGYVAISKILKSLTDWKPYMPLILKLDFEKNSKIWYGNIIRKGKNNKYSIINNSNARKYLSKRINKEFSKILENN